MTPKLRVQLFGLSGRRALYARYKPYRKERCRGVQVIMPE